MRMKIGLLITSIGNFGQKGFYNVQEIGLAKELNKFYEQVNIYKLTLTNEKQSKTAVEGCKNAILYTIPSKSVGSNGLIDLDVLDNSIDVLIYFSDTQISIPKVYRWAMDNKVQFYPYIGVIESHSTDNLKRLIMDFLFKRNLKVYKKCHCLVKTPKVQGDLSALGVKNITVAPVGLDVSLTYSDYAEYSAGELKRKYGFSKNDKVALFIGRLTEEKQPSRMIDIFNELQKKVECYKLLVVGAGELKDAVLTQINNFGIGNKVKMIDSIPNCDIWELYCFADVFVNLNKQEIFGMAILEAMYYGCKVVAWQAPGPNLIIEEGISGYLVNSNKTALEAIVTTNNLSEAAHQRVIENFTWRRTASAIYDLTVSMNS